MRRTGKFGGKFLAPLTVPKDVSVCTWFERALFGFMVVEIAGFTAACLIIL